jgi:hypothetical protein
MVSSRNSWLGRAGAAVLGLRGCVDLGVARRNAVLGCASCLSSYSESVALDADLEDRPVLEALLFALFARSFALWPDTFGRLWYCCMLFGLFTVASPSPYSAPSVTDSKLAKAFSLSPEKRPPKLSWGLRCGICRARGDILSAKSLSQLSS